MYADTQFLVRLQHILIIQLNCNRRMNHTLRYSVLQTPHISESIILNFTIYLVYTSTHSCPFGLENTRIRLLIDVMLTDKAMECDSALKRSPNLSWDEANAFKWLQKTTNDNHRILSAQTVLNRPKRFWLPSVEYSDLLHYHILLLLLSVFCLFFSLFARAYFKNDL